MKYKVKLPAMNWFNHGKVYTGSLGTDPMKGCSSCTTFNYRIKLVKDDARQKDETILLEEGATREDRKLMEERKRIPEMVG